MKLLFMPPAIYPLNDKYVWYLIILLLPALGFDGFVIRNLPDPLDG